MSSVEQNAQVYKKKLAKFVAGPSHKNAQQLLRYVLKNPSGIYYLKELEEYYIKRAQEGCNTEVADITGDDKSYLHVLTKAFKTGGHTRMVERWLLASSEDERHSVCLLDQQDAGQVPELLGEAARARGGELLQWSAQGSLEHQAVRLYELAAKFKYVVLHHHPYDPIPLMAFSFVEVNPRVILFNHAGHLPWIGVGAVDLALSHDRLQGEITRHMRGCDKNLLMDLIMDESKTESSVNKHSAREQIGIDDATCALVTMAESHKYNPVNGYSIVEDLSAVLAANESIVFMGIGIPQDTPQWQGLRLKFGDRVKLLGVLPYSEVQAYLRAADIYLDSYPTHSWTSIIDAVWVGGLPAVVRLSPCGVMPFMEGSDAVTDSAEEWVKRVLLLSASKAKRAEVHLDLYKRIEKNCSYAFFRELVSSIDEQWGEMECDFNAPFDKQRALEHDQYRCALADATFGVGRLGRLKKKWKNSLRKRFVSRSVLNSL